MEDLKKIIKLADPDFIRDLQIVGRSEEDLADRLYHLLCEHKNADVGQIAKLLLNVNANSTKFKRVQTLLKKRLVQMVFLMDTNQWIKEDPGEAQIEATRLWAIANILLFTGRTELGHKFAERSIRLADRFSLHGLLKMSHKFLRRFKGTYLGDQRSFQLHHNDLQRAEAHSYFIDLAEEQFINVIQATSNADLNHDEIIALCNTAWQKVANIQATTPDYSIQQYTRSIEVTHLYYSEQWNQLCSTCADGISYFEQQPFQQCSIIQTLRYYWLIACVQIRDVEQGKIILQQSLGTKSPAQLFSFFELGMLLFIHNKAYAAAYQLYEQYGRKSKWRKKATGQQLMHFENLGAYLLALASESLPKGHVLNDFPIKKYLGSPVNPILDRNTVVERLVAKVVLALKEQAFSTVTTCIEQLRQYVPSKIRTDKHYRSNLLLASLSQTLDAEFHRAATQRYAAKLSAKLEKANFSISNQAHETEILPYTELWQWCLNQLPNRRIKTKRKKIKKAPKQSVIIPRNNAQASACLHTELQAMVKVVHRKKLMKLTVLGAQEATKLDRLYLAILANPCIGEEEAMVHLYGKIIEVDPFSKVKNALANRLINYALLNSKVDSINGNVNYAYAQAWKWYYTAVLLIHKNLHNAGIENAYKALKLAEEFEHLELARAIYALLRTHYGQVQIDPAKYHDYNQKLQYYTAASEVETVVEEKYIRYVMPNVSGAGNTLQNYQEGQAYINALAPFKASYPYITVRRFTAYIHLSYLINTNQYEATIKIANEAIHFIENKPFLTESTLLGFHMHKLVCNTFLKNYEAGLITYQKCVEILGHKISHSFFWVHKQAVFFFLHNRKYQQAYETCQMVLNLEQLESQNQHIREKWFLYSAYVHFLMAVGKISKNAKEHNFGKFRLQRFLNEVPVFSKDKLGMNIPIIILHVLFLLVHNRQDQMFDKIQAIEKYISRYVSKDAHFRSRCFIKMLLQIPISGFSKKMSIELAQKHRQKLLKNPLEQAKQLHDLEIIPYEDLWELALLSLDAAKAKAIPQNKMLRTSLS